MGEKDLVDITRARCWLNEVAIRKSIAHGDAAWEEQVVLSFHRLSRTPRFEPGQERERRPNWEIAHRNFHPSLASASGSRRVEPFCGRFFGSPEPPPPAAR